MPNPKRLKKLPLKLPQLAASINFLDRCHPLNHVTHTLVLTYSHTHPPLSSFLPLPQLAASLNFLDRCHPLKHVAPDKKSRVQQAICDMLTSVLQPLADEGDAG